MSDPESIQKQLDLATRAAREQRFDAAATILDDVLGAEPDNLRALDLFGFVRFFQGRYEEAEAYCRRALDTEPEQKPEAASSRIVLPELRGDIRFENLFFGDFTGLDQELPKPVSFHDIPHS